LRKSIVETLDAFRKQEVSFADAELTLQEHKQQAEQKRASISRAQVPSADKPLWEELIRPGLEVAFQGLVGAAAEGIIYLSSRDQDAYRVAIALAAQAVEITEVLEARMGLLSQITQRFILTAINPHADVIQMEHVMTGSADSTLSFLD
jgi:hypothetical protein